MMFTGFEMMDDTPDETTLCRFLNKLIDSPYAKNIGIGWLQKWRSKKISRFRCLLDEKGKEEAYFGYRPEFRVYSPDTQESFSIFLCFSPRKWPLTIPFGENPKNFRETSSDFQGNKPETQVIEVMRLQMEIKALFIIFLLDRRMNPR